MKKNSWILIIVLLVGILAGAGFFYNKYSTQVGRDSLMTEDDTRAEIEDPVSDDSEIAESGEPSEEENFMPDFTVYDMDGNAVKLSDFRGKPVVLNFWASWCGPCKSEMPEFDSKYLEMGEEVHFLMVNMTDGGQETKERAQEFINQSGYSFPVYYDLDMDAAMTYGVTSIPSTYFIDAEGHGIAWAQGMIDGATLQQGIDMITDAQ